MKNTRDRAPVKPSRDIAVELAEYKLNPWNVTQRIRRMNKRLDRHIVKEVAENSKQSWESLSRSGREEVFRQLEGKEMDEIEGIFPQQVSGCRRLAEEQ